MKILMASSEAYPYSKTGGLADMVAALAKYMARAGHQVGVVTPLYRNFRKQFPDIRPFTYDLDLPLGSHRVKAKIALAKPAPRLTYYFVDQPKFFNRNGLYHDSKGDYRDNDARYMFFAKAIVHLARYLPLQPDIVHVHDWQTGFVPLFVRHQSERDQWVNPPKTCMTIHNLAYQGIFATDTYSLSNLPTDYFHSEAVEYFDSVNYLKTGIVFADHLTTVSPRYAREITTKSLGCGLDGVLRNRRQDLTGILNGVDEEEWNPRKDAHLVKAFSASNLKGKTANKLALQKKVGLPVRPEVPLFASINRLVEQKGCDLLLAALQNSHQKDLQFIQLGSGARSLERAFQGLARKHPTKVAVRLGYDHELSHQIEAASDFFIMPSLYEPCGLNQMYSLRYGSIPIVRATGGLDDSVVDAREDVTQANGIKFSTPVAAALTAAIDKALALYQAPHALLYYRRNAMRADFSWRKSAEAYATLFDSALV